MNGQDIPQAACNVAGGTNGSSSNGAPSGVISSASWFKEMTADPLRSSQLDLSAVPSLPPNFTYQSLNPYSPLVHATNMLSSMQPRLGDQTTTTSAAAAALTQQQRLLMSSLPLDGQQMKAYNPRFHNLQKDMAASLKHPSASAATAELPNKRVRVEEKQYSQSAEDYSTSPANSASGPSSKMAPIPHRPDYFHKGSIIQLGDNKLKRIEDLQTNDFDASANLSPNLCLDCSTVAKIEEDARRGTAFLTFSVGEKQNEQVCV